MSLALVYLVRRHNGLEPVRAFLDAYGSRRSGVEHRLVLALKGYARPGDADAARALAAPYDPEAVFLPDDGFDLMAYFRTAERIDSELCCLVNSFSRPLADGWLAALADAAQRPDIGLAGATGSWASQGDYVRYQLGLPSGYAGVFSDREETRQAFLELGRQSDPTLRDRGQVAARVFSVIDLVRQRRIYPPFPAVHLRTNALAVRRELLLTLRPRRVRSKLDAYRLESGRHSFTAQVRERGLRTVVVDRDGVLHDPDGWPDSETLWQGSQRGLLVSDNQTETYAQATPVVRQALARLAWGGRALTDAVAAS